MNLPPRFSRGFFLPRLPIHRPGRPSAARATVFGIRFHTRCKPGAGNVAGLLALPDPPRLIDDQSGR
jgi:hypothetical protein